MVYALLVRHSQDIDLSGIIFIYCFVHMHISNFIHVSLGQLKALKINGYFIGCIVAQSHFE